MIAQLQNILVTDGADALATFCETTFGLSRSDAARLTAAVATAAYIEHVDADPAAVAMLHRLAA